MNFVLAKLGFVVVLVLSVESTFAGSQDILDCKGQSEVASFENFRVKISEDTAKKTFKACLLGKMSNFPFGCSAMQWKVAESRSEDGIVYTSKEASNDDHFILINSAQEVFVDIVFTRHFAPHRHAVKSVISGPVTCTVK